jgi:beta-phosphoglucomutase-like phosphatase (HAD superfamily)
MPYLTALQNMECLLDTKINKADCLAIEDDPLGVTSAHIAGMKVIQRRYTRDEVPSPDADISLYDEDEFMQTIKALWPT